MFDRFGVTGSPSPIGVRGGALAIGVHAIILSLGLHSTKRQSQPARPVTISVIYSAPTARAAAPTDGMSVQAPGPVPLVLPPAPDIDPGVGRPAPIASMGSFIRPWGSPSSTDSLEPYAPGVVDQVPELLSSPPPRYPELLRQAHVEGVVVLEGVVDTLGHMEKGTLRVLSSPYPALSASAEESLAGAVFRPGRVYGRAVRVLIQIPVRFSLARR